MRVILILARYGKLLSMQCFLHCEQVSPFICGLRLLYPLAQPVCCVANLFIFRVLGSHFSFFKVCDEPFNIAVEFVKVDVCQYWRTYTSYKVANLPLEFSRSIPLAQLRPGYGDRFRGAPIETGDSSNRFHAEEPGGRHDTSRTTPPHDADHPGHI